MNNESRIHEFMNNELMKLKMVVEIHYSSTLWFAICSNRSQWSSVVCYGKQNIMVNTSYSDHRNVRPKLTHPSHPHHGTEVRPTFSCALKHQQPENMWITSTKLAGPGCFSFSIKMDCSEKQLSNSAETNLNKLLNSPGTGPAAPSDTIPSECQLLVTFLHSQKLIINNHEARIK